MYSKIITQSLFVIFFCSCTGNITNDQPLKRVDPSSSTDNPNVEPALCPNLETVSVCTSPSAMLVCTEKGEITVQCKGPKGCLSKERSLTNNSEVELCDQTGDEQTGDEQTGDEQTGDVQTGDDGGGIPVPGAGRFGSAQNTNISDEYFAPKLRTKILGAYSDVVNSKEEWTQLKDVDKKTTLYWDYAVAQGTRHVGKRDRLWGIHPTTGQPILFDDLQKTSYTIPPDIYTVEDKTPRITMLEPLRSGGSTAYPGCVGLTWNEMGTHVRLCGEFNPSVIIGSHTYSQRWTRFNNIPTPDPYVEPSPQELQGLLRYGEEEEVGRKRLKNEYDILNIYDLNAQTVTDNILPPDVRFYFPLYFELSISKVPGDFSDSACKPNRSIQYNSNISVYATQMGFPTRLPAECQFDSNRLQHYYINTRAVNIDTVNKEINESTCAADSGCKVELYNFLDGT